jgi:hypothetical protein
MEDQTEQMHALAEKITAIVGVDTEPVTKFECGVIWCS